MIKREAFPVKNAVIHCKTEDDVKFILSTQKLVRDYNEAFEGWKRYGSRLCFGIENGVVNWYGSIDQVLEIGETIIELE